MRSIILGGLILYRRYLSPLLLPTCRFIPTCSEYATEAIISFGVLKGVLLTIWRLLRCQPLCQAGYDPIPKHFSLSVYLTKFNIH